MPKPRVITRTASTLRKLAILLRVYTNAFDVLAQELEDSDARETRPDPRLRRKPKVSRRG